MRFQFDNEWMIDSGMEFEAWKYVNFKLGHIV